MSQSKRKRNGLYDEISHVAKQHYSPFSSSSSSTQSSTSYSIYKVPGTLRGVKPRAYTPRVISIGPIHIKTEKLQLMVEHKESYMSSLFQRTVQSEETGQHDFEETVCRCVDAMLHVAPRARTCYPPSVRLDVDSTARTMLVDGCFILELLMRWSIMMKTKKRENDPFFRNNLSFNNVIHDLLLLENQIPFFVLEELFRLAVERIIVQNRPSSLPLKELILQFFGNKMNSHFKLTIKDGASNEKADHILGLLHSCYQYGVSDPGDYMISKYSATELYRSGVNLQPSKGNHHVYLHVDFKTPFLFSWFSNITTIFSSRPGQKMPLAKLPVSMPEAGSAEETVKEAGPTRNPRCCWFSWMCQLCCRATLEIPQLCITDSTESFLRNLIAFEQCSQNIPRYITSYAFLMDTIINSKEHIELLETSGVLKNYLGTGEDASNLFNNLCKEVVLGDFYFSRQWEQVDCYYKLYLPSCIASLRRTYFSNPWTGISVFAALILFALTLIQTVYSIN